jgi:methylglutaconyl-CoA hydratase
MTDTLVRTELAGGVRTITLDSPHNRNALSTALVGQLLAALAQASAEPACRVVVLSHTGTVFCSGADLKEAAATFGATPTGGATPSAGGLGEVLMAIWDSPKPVVARVGGTARAGGLGLIAAADLAIGVDEATFAFSEVRLGVVPAVISAAVLPRLTPRAAAELFLTGDPFTGARAAQIGLLTAAVPAQELDAAVERYVASLLRGGPAALAASKRLVASGGQLAATPQRLAELAALSAEFFGSAEGLEGLVAFAEKRAPSWVP